MPRTYLQMTVLGSKWPDWWATREELDRFFGLKIHGNGLSRVLNELAKKGEIERREEDLLIYYNLGRPRKVKVVSYRRLA